MNTRIVTFQIKKLLIFLGVFFCWTNLTVAQSQSKNQTKPGVIKQNLSTDMRFNDLSVRGKRQTPLGLNVVVEDEKDIPQLVDFRTNFKDRAQKSLSGR